MATVSCSACQKIIDVEPIECPYCKVVQPNRAVDGRNQVLKSLLAGCAGLILGLPAGYLAGARSLPVRSTVGSGNGHPSRDLRDLQKEKAELCAKLRDRAARAREDGSYVELEELTVEPAKYLGRSMTLIGLPNFVQIDGENDRLELFTGWGTGARVAVSISALSQESKKQLLRIQWPPHVVEVKGRLSEGLLAGATGRLRYHVVAESVVSLGKNVNSGESITQLLSENAEGCGRPPGRFRIGSG